MSMCWLKSVHGCYRCPGAYIQPRRGRAVGGGQTCLDRRHGCGCSPWKVLEKALFLGEKGDHLSFVVDNTCGAWEGGGVYFNLWILYIARMIRGLSSHQSSLLRNITFGMIMAAPANGATKRGFGVAETSQPTQMRKLCSGRMNQPKVRWWSRDVDKMCAGCPGPGNFSAKVYLALDRGLSALSITVRRSWGRWVRPWGSDVDIGMYLKKKRRKLRLYFQSRKPI
jgi:hypothetical protein